MKIANAKDGYGLCVCAKEGIGYANKGCNLKGEQQEGWDDKVIDECCDLKMSNAQQ